MKSGPLIRLLLLPQLLPKHLLCALECHTAIEPRADRHEHDQPDRQIHEKFFRRHRATCPTLSHMRWDPQPRPSQIPLAESHNYHTVHKPDPLPDRSNYESDETGHAVRSLAG